MARKAVEGPPALTIDGFYDRERQVWISRSDPQARTNYETSQPTQQTTNQSTQGGRDFHPDSYDDANRDFNSD
jgi:hypothetical protein